MEINSNNRYKGQDHKSTPTINTPLIGCIYNGNLGNNQWKTGILIKINDDISTLRDSVGNNWVVLTNTLKSVQK